MVFSKDYASARSEVEKTFNYPLDIKLDQNGCVKFGARDQIKIGHSLLSVNGQAVYLDKMDKNKLKVDDLKGAEDLLEFLKIESNFPCLLKFGKQVLNTNDKLVLTGRFFGFVLIRLIKATNILKCSSNAVCTLWLGNWHP